MERKDHWSLWLQATPSGEDFYFDKTSIRIGRDISCDMFFSDVQSISRIHVEVFYRSGTWFIRDHLSTNGTWLNQIRLTAEQEYPLTAGDVIDLAHKLQFVYMEGKAPAQAQSHAPECSSAPEQFCSFCGSRVAGSFCRCCGNPVDRFPSASACCRPSSAMPQPSMQAPPPPAPSAPPMPMAVAQPMPMAVAPAPVVPAKVPEKQGLFTKVRSLFKKKSINNADADTAVPALDDVQFRGTTPQTIRPGEYFPVKIMMYREDDHQRANRESAAVADKTTSASSSIFQAAHGQMFRIALQSPDIPLDCETQLLQWNGKFAAADFEVYLPEDYDRRQLRLRGRVYADNAVLTDLKLILQVGAAQSQSTICEKVQLRSAFISYASNDRAKVVARIQGILLARPDMELFFDVESLRRGENWEHRLYQEIEKRDLFYLFWSQSAAASEWVQKELQYALNQKTADYIEPIPLEGPDICPPPQCLQEKHFNDWTLRYLNNQ